MLNKAMKHPELAQHAERLKKRQDQAATREECAAYNQHLHEHLTEIVKLDGLDAVEDWCDFHGLAYQAEPEPPVTSRIAVVDDSPRAETWRAYPCDATTVGEMKRACERFDLAAWVDPFGRVCMVRAETADASTWTPPTITDLVEAMYPGAGQVPVEVPALLRRQAE